MDNAKNQPEKSKSPRFSRPFAIDFIVPIQLEECVARARKYTGDPELRVMIGRIGEMDRVQFDCDSHVRGMLFIMGRGTIQRWEGTSTRIHLDTLLHYADIKHSFNRMRLVLSIMLLTTILAGVHFFDFPDLIKLQLAVVWIFGFTLVYTLMFFLIASIIRYRQRRLFISNFRHLLTAES